MLTGHLVAEECIEFNSLTEMLVAFLLSHFSFAKLSPTLWSISSSHQSKDWVWCSSFADHLPKILNRYSWYINKELNTQSSSFVRFWKCAVLSVQIHATLAMFSKGLHSLSFQLRQCSLCFQQIKLDMSVWSNYFSVVDWPFCTTSSNLKTLMFVFLNSQFKAGQVILNSTLTQKTFRIEKTVLGMVKFWSKHQWYYRSLIDI